MVHVWMGGSGRTIWVSIFDNETNREETFYRVRRTREILASLGYSDIHEPEEEEDYYYDDEEDFQEEDTQEPF